MAVGGRKPCVAPQSRSMYETSIADWFARLFSIRALATAWCTARSARTVDTGASTDLPTGTGGDSKYRWKSSGSVHELAARTTLEQSSSAATWDRRRVEKSPATGVPCRIAEASTQPQAGPRGRSAV